MADNEVKVALWCVPRSMSTVFAKCMSAIDEMTVYLELYSYAAAAGGFFESATGRSFPKQLDGNEKDYEEVKEMWKKLTNATLTPRRISCHDIKRDLENAKSKYVFVKEMSYVIDFFQDYLPQGFRNVFIIREPSRVYSSFRKGFQSSEMGQLKLDGKGELDIIRDDPMNMLPMLWYEKQHQIWKHAKENHDPNPIIIDAFDLASEPQKILKGFCDAVGYPYSDSLLQWTPSVEDFPQNFVTAGEGLFKSASTFYSTALSSTHFMAPSESGPIPRDQLTDDVIRCVDHSMPFYREMFHDIKRDLENAKSKYVFIKEMSHVIDFAQDYFPQGFRYVFLIREPSRVYSSLRKSMQGSEMGQVNPDGKGELDIIRDDPMNLLPMLWYEKQHQIWKHVKENHDPNPIIIDAFDLASEPQKILKGFCDAVGFPYSDSLLQWAPSEEDFPKNFVTAGEGLFKHFSTFYSTAFRSTHFMAPSGSGPIPRDQLTDDVIRCVDHSMPFYREMYENRQQAS